MIGDVTFYPNYFWYKGYAVATYPNSSGETYTSSGGEATGPLYDLVDARRNIIVTLDTNGDSSHGFSINLTTNANISSADFFIVDNHNYNTSTGELALRDSGGSNLALSGYWGGSIGSELTAQTYSGATKLTRIDDDGIFLGLLDSASTDTQWTLYSYASSWGDDLTIGEWLVGKKFAMTVAPETPEIISNYDGVNLRITKGGQKHGFGTYGERKAWRLSWEYVTETQKDNFLTVWEVTQGPRYPFYIDLGENTNPTLYFVRFVENSLRLQKLTAGAYKLSFLIESEV